ELWVVNDRDRRRALIRDDRHGTAGFGARRIFITEEGQPQGWIAELNPKHRLEFVPRRPLERLLDETGKGSLREQLSSDQRREEAVPQRRPSDDDAPFHELGERRRRRAQGAKDLEGDLECEKQERDGCADRK